MGITTNASGLQMASVAQVVNRACQSCGSSTSPEHGKGYFDAAGVLRCCACDTPAVRENLGITAYYHKSFWRRWLWRVKCALRNK